VGDTHKQIQLTLQIAAVCFQDERHLHAVPWTDVLLVRRSSFSTGLPEDCLYMSKKRCGEAIEKKNKDKFEIAQNSPHA
jgi:hypothetical protein